MTKVIALASVKGSGGVTSSALGIAGALGMQSATVLLEADASGGSLLGWCPTLDPTVGGLYEAVFDRDRPGFASVAQRLGDIGVVVAQGDPYRIGAALERPRGWRSQLDGFADHLVVDIGRLFPGTPALALAGVADRLLLVAPPEPGPLAATVEWIGRGGQYAAVGERIEPSRIALLTADIGGDRRQRITPRRLGDELGVDHVGHLACDGATLDLLCRGASFAHRSMRRSKLAPALHAVAERLSVDSGSKVRS
jgi:MinD-like ATPase involved in chromosome partitioning or flagellar assembly